MNNFVLIQSLTKLQWAFIIIAPLVLLLFITLCLYFPISHALRKKNFQIYYYKRVYRLALDYDYYLINQFTFKIEENKLAMVDHILAGNKFIYAVISRYYDGDLIGKATDSSLVFVSHKGEERYTDNPIIQMKTLANKLSSSTGLNASLLIGIILVNDDCKVQVISESKQFYIIQRKRLRKLVRAIESRRIDTINQEQLEQAIQALAKANKRKKI